MKTKFSKELIDIIEIAREAGEIILKYYNKEHLIKEKENKTPVTEADVSVEKFIKKELNKRYDYPILGEETEDNFLRLKADKIWLVDPIDGTKGFINKTGEFSVIIGLAVKGKPVRGVVYDPIKSILYFAEVKQGAYIQIGNKKPKQIHVREKKNIHDMILVISKINQSTLEIGKKLGVKKMIEQGSLGIRVGLVASGKCDIYINNTQKASEWDTCGSEIILTEAGGKITDLLGNKLIYNKKEVRHLNGLVASNNKIHSKIIKKMGLNQKSYKL